MGDVTLLRLSKEFTNQDKWIVVASSSVNRIQVFKRNIKFTNTIFIPSQFEEDLDKSLYTPYEYIEQTALHKAQDVAKVIWSDPNPLNIVDKFDRIITPFHDSIPFTNKSTISMVIGFDTIMYKNDRIFEKPIDRNDAKNQLKYLSGDNHFILTGVAILTKENGFQNPLKLFHDSTEMKIEPMSDYELELVLDNKEYINVCGSYKIEGIGSQFATIINGCYSNIMGVPVRALSKELNKLNLIN